MKKYKILALVVLVCIFVAAILYVTVFASVKKHRGPQPIAIDPTQLYQVVDVMDGDTFRVRVNKKVITVRMLGIDTPETVDPRKPAQCYGKEASEETKSKLMHHLVTLKLNPKREVLDKYGRYLAYVYSEDGVLINEYLLERGFAREYTYGTPYSKQQSFKKIEAEARTSERGLWKQCD